MNEIQAITAGVIGMTVEGLAWAATLAKAGIKTQCTDMDEEMVNSCLEGEEMPGVMPGLLRTVQTTLANGQLELSPNPRRVIKDCPIIFVTCMIPLDAEDRPNLRFVEAIVRQIANTADTNVVVAIKAIVPPGSARAMQTIADEVVAEREMDEPISITVVAMPDLYAGGDMMGGMARRNVQIIGCDGPVPDSLNALMHTVASDGRIQYGTTLDAEVAAYAYSGLEAVYQTYMTDLTQLCAAVGADAKVVADAVNTHADGRRHTTIGGVGIGGSHIPREIAELHAIAQDSEIPLPMVDAVTQRQPVFVDRAIARIDNHFGDIAGMTIAVLGLSPVPDTDDMREAPGLAIIKHLVSSGVNLHLYVPSGGDQAKWRLYKERDAIEFYDGVAKATVGADALVVLGSWRGIYRLLTPALHRRMAGNTIIDLVGAFSRTKALELGFEYIQ